MKIRTIAAFVATLCIPLLLPATTAEGAYARDPQAKYAPNNTVFAVAVTSSRVYIGGQFVRVTPLSGGNVVSRPGIAAFDRATGDLITGFHPSFTSGAVRSIAVSGDEQTVLVGGAFTTVNGVTHPKLAAVNASDGSTVQGWNTTASSMVRDIVVVGGDAYLGGAFGQVGGLPRPGLAKISVTTGAVDQSWTPSTAGGRPTALVQDGSNLVVGGGFTSISGTPRQFLGEVSLASGAVTTWAPAPRCSTCSVIDLDANVATRDIVAGIGGPGGHGTDYDADTGVLRWDVPSDGNVQAITTDGIDVYLGGHFGPSPGDQLVAVNRVTGDIDSTFNPSFPGNPFPGVWALESATEALYVGGGFVGVNGTTQSKYAVFPTAPPA